MDTNKGMAVQGERTDGDSAADSRTSSDTNRLSPRVVCSSERERVALLDMANTMFGKS